jgi:hypothetical protein
VRGEAFASRLFAKVRVPSPRRCVRVAFVAVFGPLTWVALAACGFQKGGTGSGAPLGDSAPAIDSDLASPDAFDDSSSAVEDVADARAETTADVVDSTVEADAPCTTKTGDFCKDISPLGGEQIIDGRADEFCGVDETVFDVHTGDFTDPKIAPAYVTAVARVRVAWSKVGLHFHFSVKDATFFPTPTSRPHWQGDSIELFIAGHDILTGTYDGVIDKGAMQIVFVPASGTVPARAGIYYNGDNKSELPGAFWTTREIAGGYEIEVGLPWDSIGGIPPYAVGKKIGIDFAVNDVIDADRTQYFYSVYRVVTAPLPSCEVPYCDDRVWCKPPLGAK